MNGTVLWMKHQGHSPWAAVRSSRKPTTWPQMKGFSPRPTSCMMLFPQENIHTPFKFVHWVQSIMSRCIFFVPGGETQTVVVQTVGTVCVWHVWSRTPRRENIMHFSLHARVGLPYFAAHARSAWHRLFFSPFTEVVVSCIISLLCVYIVSCLWQEKNEWRTLSSQEQGQHLHAFALIAWFFFLLG